MALSRDYIADLEAAATQQDLVDLITAFNAEIDPKTARLTAIVGEVGTLITEQGTLERDTDNSIVSSFPDLAYIKLGKLVAGV